MRLHPLGTMPAPEAGLPRVVEQVDAKCAAHRGEHEVPVGVRVEAATGRWQVREGVVHTWHREGARGAGNS